MQTVYEAAGGGPHEEMDRRAVACFDQALTDVGLMTGIPSAVC
jgi:hemoglobin